MSEQGSEKMEAEGRGAERERTGGVLRPEVPQALQLPCDGGAPILAACMARHTPYPYTSATCPPVLYYLMLFKYSKNAWNNKL